MKLSRQEKLLGIITVIFIIVFFALSANSDETTSYIENPEISVSPYLIDINSADAAELDLLEGIGPAIAERIVEYRKAHGPFNEPDDICNVPGIGQSTFEAIKENITL